MAKPGKCSQCQHPLRRGRVGGQCESCKALTRFLDDLHRWAGDQRMDPSGEKARRVAVYAERAAGERPLFTGV